MAAPAMTVAGDPPRSRDDLVRQLQFCRTENEILRAHLRGRVKVTPRERRRLLRFGKPLGRAIHYLITVVSPRTFLRWLRGQSPSA